MAHELDTGKKQRAVVVAVQLPGVTDGELRSSLQELERLAKTLGLEVIGELTQKRGKLDSGKVLGGGKLFELSRWTDGTGVVPRYEKPGSKDDEEEEEAERDDRLPPPQVVRIPDAVEEGGVATVVLVDHDLSPTQQRNLELATGAAVMDRTQVIIDIFHRHARTREARLQVEIARLKYEAPRLREGSGGADRVRGGVGGKGAGESSLELDRRRIRDRIAELRRELDGMAGTADVQRGQRESLPVVALVGYTNAGKSSLMRALTGREVYVADKLFATLDTTVRVLSPRTEPPILVSDTVGFIKKLPHDLVASFRSTLKEAAEADLVLHVIDAADVAFRSHVQVTEEVLSEVGATESPRWMLLNKVDCVSPDELAALRLEFPDAHFLSAKNPADVVDLHEKLVANFLGALEEGELFVPWSQHAVVHQIHERARVLSEAHEEEGSRLKVRAPSRVLERLRREIAG